MAILLQDGRELTVPVAWCRALVGASHDQRCAYTLLGDGAEIDWPMLGARVSVRQLLAP